MVVCGNGGGMVSVFPESPLARLSLVVFLCHSSGDQLHALGDFPLPGIFHKKVDVVAGSDVIQNTEAVSLLGLEKPSNPGSSVKCKFKQKILLMTSMSDVPDMAWQKITICPRHFPLPIPI
jgi:hypothetical protein